MRNQDSKDAIRRLEERCATLSASELRPTWSARRVAVYAMASAVHLLTLACVVGAGLIAVSSLALLLRIVLSVLLVWIAVTVRPRGARFSPDAIVLSREDAPSLYGLTDRVAHELHARPIAVIAVDASINASTMRVGWRQRPALTIGLPLWMALAPRERVALLGHEMAHNVNGDCRMGVVVGGADQALRTWHYLLAPDHTANRFYNPSGLTSPAGMAAFFAPIIQRPLVTVIEAYRRAMVAADRTDGQRAEYLADELSARVAGRDAACSTIDALLLTPSIEWAVRRAVASDSDDPWLPVREELGAMSEAHLEERRATAARQFDRVDSTHPPTHLRRKFLLSRPETTPSISISSDEALALDQELAVPGIEVLAQLGRRRRRPSQDRSAGDGSIGS